MHKLTKSPARLWGGKGTCSLGLGWGLVDVVKTTRSAQGSHSKPHCSLVGSHWHSWVPKGAVPLSSCALPPSSQLHRGLLPISPRPRTTQPQGRVEGAAEFYDYGSRGLISPGQGRRWGLLAPGSQSHLSAPSPQLVGICSAFCSVITALPGLTPAFLCTAPEEGGGPQEIGEGGNHGKWGLPILHPS